MSEDAFPANAEAKDGKTATGITRFFKVVPKPANASNLDIANKGVATVEPKLEKGDHKDCDKTENEEAGAGSVTVRARGRPRKKKQKLPSECNLKKTRKQLDARDETSVMETVPVKNETLVDGSSEQVDVQGRNNCGNDASATIEQVPKKDLEKAADSDSHIASGDLPTEATSKHKKPAKSAAKKKAIVSETSAKRSLRSVQKVAEGSSDAGRLENEKLGDIPVPEVRIKTKKTSQGQASSCCAADKRECNHGPKRDITNYFKSSQDELSRTSDSDCGVLQTRVKSRKIQRNRPQSVAKPLSGSSKRKVRRKRFAEHSLRSEVNVKASIEIDIVESNKKRKVRVTKAAFTGEASPVHQSSHCVESRLRRSPRLSGATEPKIKDSCTSEEFRDSERTLQAQSRGRKFINVTRSSYKVALLRGKRGHKGIRIRLTRLFNQDDKPVVQKADGLLKRAKKITAPDDSKSSSTNQNGQKPGVARRLAPIFLQQASKKSMATDLDEAKVERRKQFLMSGIPEQLKKQIQRAEACGCSDFTFPTIGHIQQRGPTLHTDSLWNLEWPPCFDKWNFSDESSSAELVSTSLELGIRFQSTKLASCSAEEASPDPTNKVVTFRSLSCGDVNGVLSEIRERYDASENVDGIYQSYVQKRRAAISVVETSPRRDGILLQTEAKQTSDSSDHPTAVAKRKREVITLSNSEDSTSEKRHRREESQTQRKRRSSSKANRKCAEEPRRDTKSWEEAAPPAAAIARTEETECVKPIETGPPSQTNATTALWTTAYKPVSGDEVIGNKSSVAQLKSWLGRWKKSSQNVVQKEQTHRKVARKRSKDDFDSDSDFESRWPDLCNTVLLVGPSGSGKSSAVYALASELGYKVLDVNSTSKRSGKQVLAQLQEATQSHQVGEQRWATASPFTCNVRKPAPRSNDKGSSRETQPNQETGVVSLILFQDVDVVFAEDDGFWNAVNSFMSTAKRPIVLTSSDLKFKGRGRIKEEYEEIVFGMPDINLQCLHLQLLCLAECALLGADDCFDVVAHHRGNYRQCLLTLQFWNNPRSVAEDKAVATTLPQTTITSTRSMFPGSDEHSRDVEPDMKLMNCILHLSNNYFVANSVVRFRLLKSMSLFLDNVCNESLSDVLRTLGSNTEILPGLDDDESEETDRNQFLEQMTGNIADIIRSLNQTVFETSVDSALQDCKTAEEEFLKKGLPGRQNNDSVSKKSCVGSLRAVEYLPVTARMNSRACCLDYLPALRAISKSELNRQLAGDKRNRRFSHYLSSNVLYVDEATLTDLANGFQS